MYTKDEHTTEEIKNVQEYLRREKNNRMRIRYHVIELHLKGNLPAHIAHIFSLHPQTVMTYIKVYTQNGIDSLKMNTSTGRPRQLSTEQEKQVYDVITNYLPKEVGFEPFVNWTAPLACQWVKKELGISFSERGMREVFYRLKLSYTRPTYTLAHANSQKQEEFKQAFQEIKKTGK